jgi:hypothetical protein
MSASKSPNLGETPYEDARRDAVHVAVAPVGAAEQLEPGEHIGLSEDGRASTDEKPIGVVDPFLRSSLPSGQRFWLFLFPGTITSFRHVWTHPAFTVKVPAKLSTTQ